MSITWKLYDRFFLYYISADKPQSSLSLKSIVTVGLAAQNAHWSNFTLQSNANTFVKVDAQIEEECRRTLSYLQGYSCPKPLLQETEYSSQHKKSVLNAGQTERTSIYQSCCLFAFLFLKRHLNKAKYSIYRNRLPVFGTEGSGLEEKYRHHLQDFNRSIFSYNENPCIW